MSTGNFQYTSLASDIFKENLEIDLNKLYELACKELALQQTKRDAIINLYLVIFSFLVPFIFSLKEVSPLIKGVVLSNIGFIGIIFSVIAVRYRVYKEAYWITCATITQLGNLKSDKLTKANIQSLFYRCMEKKWKNYIVELGSGNSRFNKWKIFKGNIFSAETLYFMILVLITVITLSLGIFISLNQITDNLAVALIVSLLIAIKMLSWQLWLYYHNLEKIYAVLVDKKESSFNYAFSKAWFLHFYKE